MSDKADEKEVWKQYPDYDFIEVSNLGRVRTKDRYAWGRNGSKRLIKGRVLKQWLSKKGYMYVNFKVNGKTVNLLVHRTVAITFLPNPNNYPEVNHKDNDRKNNSTSNLEWCSRKYNEEYKKNFGTTSAEVLGKPVFAVNLETGKILRFETQSEAARQLDVSQASINSVIKGKLNQTGGYWFTENESEITEEKIREIKEKIRFFGRVIAVNLDTFEILCFKSQSKAARQLGADSSRITQVAKGKRNETHGYWFCYVDENTVEKARKRFGDEIACKVEELISQNQN